MRNWARRHCNPALNCIGRSTGHLVLFFAGIVFVLPTNSHGSTAGDQIDEANLALFAPPFPSQRLLLHGRRTGSDETPSEQASRVVPQMEFARSASCDHSFENCGEGRFMAANSNPEASVSNVLDIVDYQAKATSIEERGVQQMLALPKFRAAVAAYAGGHIPLGYAAFFCWDETKAASASLTPAHLMDLIRYAARRKNELDVSDARHIALDVGRALAEFPRLFRRMDGTRLKEFHDEFMTEMGDFAALHPWRGSYLGTIRFKEETEYAGYWSRSSPDRIAPLMANRKFLAGLDAGRQGLLSYKGFLDKIYGDGRYILFPEIGFHLSALVFNHWLDAIRRGEINLPNDLRTEFPDLY